MSILKNVSFIAFIFLLWTSCSQEEEAPVAEKENFGYAHGMMNGEYFSVDNDDYYRIDPVVTALFSIETTWENATTDFPAEVVDSTSGIVIKIPEKGRYIGIVLKHLHEGTFFQDGNEPAQTMYTEMGFYPKSSRVLYLQNAEHPIRVDLKRAEYRDKWVDIPAIEGILNGVFYNTVNPKDSIVLEDVAFGVH
ncbi:MAG: DUF5025 domain-containing protein [Mediterranea sp.]|nr:DUF5025 domain-containing protein [Mediterranea sp.]